MKSQIEKLIEVAESLDWRVSVEENEVEFQKYSPAGQDFCMSISAENTDELKEKLYERCRDHDPSAEAYLWLDNTGHGINGAPYDMKDVYEDMEACGDMILELYEAL